jgi:hypothetical protein
MGQEMGRQTATGVEQNINASYAQTEPYFSRHCNHLMPRVHQMRTDLAQFYHSTKPSIRLQYVTTKDERINFEINGTDLLNRDIGVIATTDSLTRNLLESFKEQAIKNNTAGASIYDLGELYFNGDSKSEIMTVLRDIEEKASKAKEEERQHELEMQKQEIEAEKEAEALAFERTSVLAANKEKNEILVAEIRAAGYGAAVDVDKNGQNDFLDAMGVMQKQTAFQEEMNLEKSKETSKQALNDDKQAVQREKMQNQIRLKQMDLQIAEKNRNKFDKKPTPKKK